MRSLIAFLLLTTSVFGQHHQIMMNTAPENEATYTLSRDTNLSEILECPPQDHKIVIPEQYTLTVDGEFTQPIKWIRVNGTLHFPHNKTTSIRAVHIVGNMDSTILVGGKNGEHLQLDKTCTISFPARDPWSFEKDPSDVIGGLMTGGKLLLLGNELDTVVKADFVRIGEKEFNVTSSNGWKLGDRLLFPGLLQGKAEHEFGVVTSICKSISGETVTLESPLQFNHALPNGRATVINTSQNIILKSESTDILYRAHMMIHHVANGSITCGVKFVDMGRTDGTKPHTDIGLNLPDGQRNTNSRYPYHIHGSKLNGMGTLSFDWSLASEEVRQNPHRLKHCFVENSPKHGFVLHGTYGIYEDYAAYNVNSAGTFVENGYEVGRIDRFVSVKNNLSQSRPDHSHAGNAVWNQTPLVHITNVEGYDNRWGVIATEFIGPYRTPQQIPNYGMSENNLKYPWLGYHGVSFPQPSVPLEAIDAHATDITGAGIGARGLHIEMNRNINAPSTYKNVELYNCGFNALWTTYCRHIKFINVKGVSLKEVNGAAGVEFFNNSHFLTLDNVNISKFKIAYLESGGVGSDLTIINSSFDKEVNVSIYRIGTITIDNNICPLFEFFAPSPGVTLPSSTYNTSIERMFGRTVLMLNGRQAYHVHQLSDFVPFNGESIPPQINGKTNAELSTLGKMIYGAVIDSSLGREGVEGFCPCVFYLTGE